MPRLVPLATDPPDAFVRGLVGAWRQGHAVLPVDHRLPAPARRRLLERLGAAGEVLRGDAVVVPTSGTTGEPKGVVLTHAALLASALASSARLGVDPGRDAWLAALPLGHIGGLAVVTRALATGTPFTFDPDDRRATLVALVPTQVDRMDTSGFRVVLTGGGADWRAAERPANVVHSYGLTEAGSGVAYDGVPLDGVEVRVDDGGQVLVRGPVLLRCYRDGTDPKDADGWFATGDAGSVGPDGRLVVHGRMGDVIVTGGEKVWPDPVEDALRRHPAVLDAAVAGRPDDEWGERVVAYVVPRPAAEPPSLAALREVVAEDLPRWAAPKELVLVEAVPRTASGKVRRAALGAAG